MNCASLFVAAVALLSEAQAQNIKRNIPYANPAHERQVLDVYSPHNAKDLPVVFWIHGGGWQTGDKSDVQIKPKVFMDKGFVFVSTNYRLLPSVDMATLVRDTLCATLSGLSKVYRACGYRVGWAVFSGRTRAAADYLSSLELLSSLRLCSNVLSQWAVQTALGGYQSVKDLVSPGGRLYESRRTILSATDSSRFLRLAPPKGAMYAFVGVDARELPAFDDQKFALDLLEQKHVLVAPGVSFNVPYRNHFRVTTLPDPAMLREVFGRIEELLQSYASTGTAGARAGEAPAGNVVEATSRFK